MQCMSDGSLPCGIAGARSKNWAQERGISKDNPEKLKAVLLQEDSDLDPVLCRIIEAGDTESITVRPLYMLHIGATWDYRPGLTLIGDAVHVFRAIKRAGMAGTPESLDVEIRGFEQDKYKRMAPAEETSL